MDISNILTTFNEYEIVLVEIIGGVTAIILLLVAGIGKYFAYRIESSNDIKLKEIEEKFTEKLLNIENSYKITSPTYQSRFNNKIDFNVKLTILINTK